MMIKTKSILIALLSVLTTSSCGRETLRDNIQREMDRNRENAAILNQSYSAFQGVYRSDTSVDRSPYLVELNVAVLPAFKDGSVVPQPALSGVFYIWRKSEVKNNITPRDQAIPFNFSNGTYDNGTGTFAAKVTGINTDGILVSCQTDADNVLQCIWLPSSGRSPRFDFRLRRVGSLSAP